MAEPGRQALKNRLCPLPPRSEFGDPYWGLKLAMVRVFIPWKSISATNQDDVFVSPEAGLQASADPLQMGFLEAH